MSRTLTWNVCQSLVLIPSIHTERVTHTSQILMSWEYGNEITSSQIKGSGLWNLGMWNKPPGDRFYVQWKEGKTELLAQLGSWE